MKGEKMGSEHGSISIGPDELDGLLQRVLGSPLVRAGEWDLQRLTGGLEFGAAIYRLQGQGQVGGKTQPWSLILKILQPDPRTDDPHGYRCWKREVLAYQSSLLQDGSGPVIAPRCYGIHEDQDGSVRIWLEDARDGVSHPWSIEQYASTARLLGRFNGAGLAGGVYPDQTWFSQRWLHQYLEHAAPMVVFIRQNPAHPIVQMMLPGISLPLTLALWEERRPILKVLDRLPQTFCHQDAFERNLFLRSGQVVAIDWGYAGLAPVGAELAPLIGVAFGLGGFPSAQAKDLDRVCFEGYLEGLRQAGWIPNPHQVRMGYALTVLLRYILGATVGELLPGLLEEQTRRHWVEGLGTTPEKAGESDPGIVAYYQATAMEALKLLGPGMMIRVVLRTLFYVVRLGGKRRSRS